MDIYSQRNIPMDVTGSLRNDTDEYQLNNMLNISVKDPYQVPDLFDVGAFFNDAIITALDMQEGYKPSTMADLETAMYWLMQKTATSVGLTRKVRWLTTDDPKIYEGNTYWLEVKVIDKKYPDFETIIKDSTTVPGNFEIIYPQHNSRVESSPNLRLQWTKSQSAKGYRIIATTPMSPYKIFDTAISANNLALDVPLFFKEKGKYHLQIWSIDNNYLDYLSQRLEGQRVNRTHLFDYGQMNLSALVVFGSRVMRSVEFTVE
jgi:hypothetical protein